MLLKFLSDIIRQTRAKTAGAISTFYDNDQSMTVELNYTGQYYPQYEIGKGTYGKPFILSWGERATIKIGAYCSIADGAMIFLGGNHRPDWVTTYPLNYHFNKGDVVGHPATNGDVIIGNDVWIGLGATILSGVTIGDGVVVATQSLVAKDIPPYTIVGGNPAREIKKRFSDDIINRLLNIKWWNWEDEKIKMAMPFLLNNDIERFLEFNKIC